MSKSIKSLYKTSKTREKKGIQFPKRIILIITSHGSIIEKEDDSINNSFVIPDGIYLKRAYASLPGVCNFVDDDSVDFYIRTIRRQKGNLERPTNFDTIDETIAMLWKVFKKRDATYIPTIHSMIRKKDDINMEEIGATTVAQKDLYFKRTRDYMNMFEDSFRITNYSPGDRVVNKLFSRDNSEVSHRKKSWVIRMLNVSTGTLDLLTLFHRQTRHGESQMDLKTMIELLKSKGVEEIVLFDFSCSTFIEEFKPNRYRNIRDRNTRAKRRKLMNPQDEGDTKYGGRTTRKKCVR